MGAVNHTCIICGVPYHHCDDCSNISSFVPWRAVCDTVECYQTYLLVRDYQAGRVTKEQAKTMFSGIGLPVERVIPEVRAIVDSFLKSDELDGQITIDETLAVAEATTKKTTASRRKTRK